MHGAGNHHREHRHRHGDGAEKASLLALKCPLVAARSPFADAEKLEK